MTCDFDEMVRRYQAGEPMGAIAADAGIAVPTLASRLRRAGVPARTHLRREHALAELARSNGATVGELALRLEASPSTIYVWARLAGVTIARAPRPRTPLPPELVRRYLAREETVAALALEHGLTYRGLQRKLKRAGLTPRPRLPVPACDTCGGPISSRRVRRCRKCRSRPAPAPRECAFEGCSVVFVPPARKLARGAGRFHSLACAYADRRGKPIPHLTPRRERSAA